MGKFHLLSGLLQRNVIVAFSKPVSKHGHLKHLYLFLFSGSNLKPKTGSFVDSLTRQREDDWNTITDATKSSKEDQPDIQNLDQQCALPPQEQLQLQHLLSYQSNDSSSLSTSGTKDQPTNTDCATIG